MALSHKVNRFSLGSSSNIDKKLDIDLVTKHLKKDNATSSSKTNSDKQKNEEEEKDVQAESTENEPEQAKHNSRYTSIMLAAISNLTTKIHEIETLMEMGFTPASSIKVLDECKS